MSRESSPFSPFRRRKALAAARWRLRRVEIETHRIEAELALLESANEHAIAEELSERYQQPDSFDVDIAEGQPAVLAVTLETSEAVGADEHSTSADCLQHVAEPVTASAEVVDDRLDSTNSLIDPPVTSSLASSLNDQPTSDLLPELPRVTAASPPRLFGVTLPSWASPAWVASFGVHVAILIVGASLTSALLITDSSLLGAIEIELQPTEEFQEPIVTAASFDEVVGEEGLFGDPSVPISDVGSNDLMTVMDDAPIEQAAGLGQLSAIPSDLGTLMVGTGSDPAAGLGDGMLPGGGKGGKGRGGRRGGAAGDKLTGKASFFGAEARGDRIVFLVDNSGSMKQGRMETTVFELLRSVGAMTEKQQFYVVFYSDQAYPMFYPNGVMQALPATRENKQKLLDWVQTVELCIGGEIVKAMEFAASLHPDVVYLLSDGEIDSPQKMQRLTDANDSTFVVHTLGMGVKKPADAQNLVRIAEAHHGTFLMVAPVQGAIQHARSNPIRANGRGISWGAGTQPRVP